MSKIIEVKNLQYSVGRKKILENLSFSVEESSIVGIVGIGGSGKTTLLKLLAGILPSYNSILLGYGYLNPKTSLEDLKKIGCVFPQDFVNLFDTVYQELAFPLENLCYPVLEIEQKLKDLVNYFDVSYLLDKRTIDLTEEESLVLQILIALIHEPKVLIMDNPFLMMRTGFKKNFMSKFIEYIKKYDITTILSASRLEDILFTDYLYVLDCGEIVMEGKSLDVLKEDVRLKKLGLGLPFMVDLSMMFKFYEILDDVYLDMKELVDRLWS